MLIIGMRSIFPAIAAILALLTGCATPVGVTRITREEGWQALTAGVLSGGSLSAETQQVLNRSGLTEEYRKHPERALSALSKGAPATGAPDRAFAQAELSFLYATRSGGKPYFLEAALRAYEFLFPAAGGQLDPLDPRSRRAAEIYNQGILKGLAGENGEVTLTSGTYRLPWGELHLRTRQEEFMLGSYRLRGFKDPSLLRVRGLRNQYRWPGLGAPLVAALEVSSAAPTSAAILMPQEELVGVTALLVPEEKSALSDAVVAARLELRTTAGGRYWSGAGYRLPLEFWPSSAIAMTLHNSPIYKRELKSLLRSDAGNGGLYMLEPYAPGRVPVVLVHGTASSPARWAQLINEIYNDRELWGRCQIWLFGYDTGNPILYSSGLFVDALRRAVGELDPAGGDAALRNMVIIGHSQGGLLARLAVTSSGDAFSRLLGAPLDELKVSSGTRDQLRRSTVYEPLPFVRRVVFMGTPHRGSHLSKGPIGRLASGLIALPKAMLAGFQEVLFSSKNSVFKTLPTSVEEMRPGSGFLGALSASSLPASVPLHSIIAVKSRRGPSSGWSDGVVSYDSAHLDGAASELVVKSRHSVQETPAAIEEIRRILLEHLKGP